MNKTRIAALAAAFIMIPGAAALADGIPGHRGTELDGFDLGTKQISRSVKQYYEIFESAGRQYGIDPNVLAAICMQESAGINYSYREDGTAYPAWGIMQIEYTHEKAFAQFGLKRTGTAWTLEDRLDPAKAVPYAAYLLSESLYRYDDDYIKMIQAYNFGDVVLNRIINAVGDNWLDERINAAKYADNWKYDKYGDAQYAEHVLAYYTDTIDNVSAQVRVNDVLVKFNDQYPVIENGTTLIPIRALSETLGADVEWDEAERKVLINKDETDIEITIGEEYAYVNENEYALNEPAAVENGRTMVPLRFAAESLGCNVEWDDSTRMVVIDI